RNILDFEKDFPGARTVRLEQNYRSTRTILDAANRVIAENRDRKGKTLRTDAAAGERLTLLEAADEGDEARWVVEELQARRGDDPELRLKDFVVLYRTNAQSRSLEEALRREAVPYRVIGGTRFYERREIKDALAYLRLVANPAADEAFLRIVNVPKRGIGDTSVARLGEFAVREGIPLLRAAERVAAIEEIRGRAGTALAELAGLVAKHAATADRLPLAETLRLLVEDSGLLESLKEEGPEGRDRVGNVEELIAGAAELEARLREDDPELMLEMEEGDDVPRAIDLFLAHVALVADIDQHDPQADTVSLMSLHNAKGLEFPVVFITGLEEGLFPLVRAMDERAQLEEERRLFYVGITRAERKLYLAYARRRRRGGEWMDSVPSSFLESVPADLLETRKTERLMERASGFSQPWKSFSSAFSTRRQRLGLAPAPPQNGDDPSYQVDYSDTQEVPSLVKGARVRHPQFGAGTVAELSGYGRDVKATIVFDDAGRRTVIVRYANLEAEFD
ncbi:MAG TPA: 3'-5' exonuclease, partial [Longimicrobiaceae bacterium]|nr:3'-5' exonuclease [Longimicrobiaceae bacterium]